MCQDHADQELSPVSSRCTNVTNSSSLYHPSGPEMNNLTHITDPANRLANDPRIELQDLDIDGLVSDQLSPGINNVSALCNQYFE